MPGSTDRIAVCSWSLGPENAGELIASLERIAVRRVQLALSPLIREPKRWEGAVPALESAGVTIVSGMMSTEGEDYSTLESIARTGGVRPDETWPANEEHAEAVAGLAAQHGIRLVTFHAGFIPENAADQERAKLIDRLQRVADLFGSHDIQLGFETGQETASTLLDALREIDRPNVGVNFDPANMILYDMGDPVAALERLSPHVVQIHVKDAIQTEMPGEWGDEVPAGDGAVAWGDFFEVAESLSPPVEYVIEREAGDTREQDIARAVRIIRSHIH